MARKPYSKTPAKRGRPRLTIDPKTLTLSMPALDRTRAHSLARSMGLSVGKMFNQFVNERRVQMGEPAL